MLVSKSIVTEWFKTTSPMYQNYKFLFQNRMWNKRMPGGAAVCPFFWLSLLGLLFVRPFEFLIMDVIRPVMKFIGKPASHVDNFGATLLKFFFNSPRQYGVGKGIGVMSLIALSALATLFKTVLLPTYILLISGNIIATLAFWVPVSYILLKVVMVWYKDRQRYAEITPCDTTHHFWLWAVPALLSIILLTPAGTIPQAFNTIGYSLYWCVTSLFAFIIYLITSVGWYAWLCIKWSFAGFGLIVLLTILGFAVTALLLHLLSKHTQDPAQDKQNNIDNWFSYLTSLLYADMDQECNIIDRCACHMGDSPANVYDAEIIDRTLRIKLPSLLHNSLVKISKVLAKHGGPEILNKKDRKYILSTERFVAKLYMLRHTMLQLVDKPHKSLASESFPNNILKDSLYTGVDAYIKTECFARDCEETRELFQKESIEAIELNRRRLNSFTYRACQRVSALASRVTEGTKVLGKYCVSATKAAVHSVAPFAAYTWIAIKAKKQGACPYFRFEQVGPVVDTDIDDDEPM